MKKDPAAKKGPGAKKAAPGNTVKNRPGSRRQRQESGKSSAPEPAKLKLKTPAPGTPQPKAPKQNKPGLKTLKQEAQGPKAREPKTPEQKALKPAGTAGKSTSSGRKVEELEEKVRELEETIDAIRSGEVDAIVVGKGEERQVYTLEGADKPYRVLVENIREGVLTLSEEGSILYGNTQFGAMVDTPCRKTIGGSFSDFVCPGDRPLVAEMLRDALAGPVKSRLNLCHKGGTLPVQVTLNPLETGGHTRISAIITNRKEDEDRIRMQARMLDAVGEAVIAADTGNKVVYWNDAASRIYGWAPGEVLGRDLVDVATPEISQKEARNIAAQIAKGMTWSGEYVVRHRDGHEFPIHANDAPVFDDNGNLLAIIGASYDISDQKGAEEQLRYHAMLVETVTDAIISTDKELRIRSWNKAAERMYGWRADEVLGKTGSEILRTEFPETTGREVLTDSLFETGSWKGELIQRTKDDRKIVVEATSISIRDGAGTVTGGVSVVRDISERKQAEEALRKSEEELRHIVEYAPASIYEISCDGQRFIRVNDAMCRILGYPREELMAMNPSAILETESRKRFRERIRKRSRGEDIDESIAYQVLTKDGRTLWVTLNIKADHGKGESTLVVAHDITERKQAEEKIRTTLQRFYGILSEMRYGILLVTADDRVEFANQAFCAMFGSPDSPADLPGLPAGEIIRKIRSCYHDPRAAVARIREIVRTGEPVKGEEVGMSGDRTYLRDFVPVLLEGEEAGRLWIHIDITGQKRTEEALRMAHQRTATILEGIADTFYSLDSEWRFTTVNPAAEKAPFGRPASELLGRVIWDLYPALVGTRIHRHYLDAAAGNSMEHYEAESPINRRWYEVFMQGRDGGVDVYMRDITDRKQAEEALRETGQYLDNLINYANAPIIVWDPQFRITRFNHAFEQMTGLTAGEVNGQHLSIVFPEQFRDAAMDVILRTMAGERLNVVELPIRGKDGDVRVVLWNSATLYDQDGTTVSSTIAQGQDITGRKIAEEALRLSEVLARERSDELALLIEAVPAAVWIAHDPAALHITGNALSDEWLRIPHGAEASRSAPEGLRPETFRMFSHGRELEPAEMPVQRSAAGAEIRNYEFDFVYHDGTRRTVLGNSTPLKDAEGNPRGSVSSFMDITDRKQAEDAMQRRHDDLAAAYEEITATQEELHQNVEELTLREQELLQSEAKLKDALAEKEILLSEIHHRVKNNLAAFISLLSLDGTYEDTDAGRALRKDLQNRARSMALIHETLYRTGKFSSVDMEIYLSTLIYQIAATFRGNVVVHTVVDARGVVLDLARATTAGLIINELVTNSFKYAFPASFDCMEVRGEPCTVRVLLTEEDGSIVLSVADNGCGLPAGLDPLVAKSLGLRLVNFLGRHQLRAEIAVRENKGTEFVFRMDKTEEHA